MLRMAVDRFVGQRLTLIAPQVQLNQAALPSLLCEPARGQRIPPEVLHVLDVGVSALSFLTRVS